MGDSHVEGALCCSACWDILVPEDAPLSVRLSRGMMLCPFCGNKRCPKASNHTNGCSGSNDPGQPGSRY